MMVIRPIVTLAAILFTSTAWSAEPVTFPWGCQQSSAASTATSTPYQVMTKASHGHSVQVPLQQLPPKTGYAYGWFGVNANPTLGRHFGHSRDFTQWSSR